MFDAAINVLNDQFMRVAQRGLLVFINKNKKVTYAGWIGKVAIVGHMLTFTLGIAIIHRHGQPEWERLQTFSFDCPDLDKFVAIKDDCGHRFTSSGSDDPIFFAIYPDKAIRDMSRTYETLIASGRLFE